jgi:hypothetical protein
LFSKFPNLNFIVDLDEGDAVKLMETSCRAAFLHNIKQHDREIQHALCPKGPNSWCTYHKDKYVSLQQKIDPIKNIKRLDPVSKSACLSCN